MKRLRVNLDNIAIAAMVGVLVIVAVMNALTPWPSEPKPCPATTPRANIVLTVSNDTMIVDILTLNGRFDGFFIRVWPNDSQPPDVFTNGTCYASLTSGVTVTSSDNLRLHVGEAAICYFDLTQANRGVPLTKGEKYYYAVYGKSCYRILQLARGAFVAGYG